ncbi:hypothetical protein [Sphaerisporangium fuscum]|nr:hypothetical protein [Sphaerisporangium fuscum]
MDLELSALDMLPGDEQTGLMPCTRVTCLLVTCDTYTCFGSVWGG